MQQASANHGTKLLVGWLVSQNDKLDQGSEQLVQTGLYQACALVAHRLCFRLPRPGVTATHALCEGVGAADVGLQRERPAAARRSRTRPQFFPKNSMLGVPVAHVEWSDTRTHITTRHFEVPWRWPSSCRHEATRARLREQGAGQHPWHSEQRRSESPATTAACQRHSSGILTALAAVRAAHHGRATKALCRSPGQVAAAALGECSHHGYRIGTKGAAALSVDGAQGEGGFALVGRGPTTLAQ